jgi:uncharacterized protein YpmS
MVMKSTKVLALIIFALFLSVLACNLSFPWGSSREPVPVTTEAAERLEETVEDIVEDYQPGKEISLIITETQLTSIIAFKLEESAGDIVSNPQVYLRDGQIQINGNVNTQGISAPAQVKVEVSVDVLGRPDLNVVSATVGPFPIPEDMISEVDILINDAFQEQIELMAPNLQIEDIFIADGSMTIIGRTK